MAKSSTSSKVVRSGNSLTIILTDEHKKLFDLSELGYLTVRRDGSGLKLEIGAVHMSNITVGVVAPPPEAAAVEPSESSRSVADPSPSKPVKVQKEVSSPKSAKIEKKSSSALTPVKEGKTRTGKPRTEKSIEAERTAKEQSLVKRLTRMGLRTDREVEEDLHSLPEEVQLAIHLPGLLWKEYAVEKSLAGYLSVKEGRESETATPCLKHSERKEKLKAAMAGLTTGQCLFRRSSYEGKTAKKEEAADEAKVDESSFGSEDEEDSQATGRYSSSEDSFSALPDRLSQESYVGVPNVVDSSWKTVTGKPRGSSSNLPPQKDDGGYGGGDNRKVGPRPGL